MVTLISTPPASAKRDRPSSNLFIMGCMCVAWHLGLRAAAVIAHAIYLPISLFSLQFDAFTNPSPIFCLLFMLLLKAFHRYALGSESLFGESRGRSGPSDAHRKCAHDTPFSFNTESRF